MKKYLAILIDYAGFTSSVEVFDSLEKEIIIKAFQNDLDVLGSISEIIVLQSADDSLQAPKIIKHWSEINGDFNDVDIYVSD